MYQLAPCYGTEAMSAWIINDCLKFMSGVDVVDELGVKFAKIGCQLVVAKL